MRRLIVAGVVGLLGVTTFASASAVSPTAHTAREASRVADSDHIGPDKIAWYDESRPAAAAPAAPMAGVGPKDLVVEGVTINTALLPISLPIPPIRQVTAFTALSFTLPAGTTPASLTLKLSGFNTTIIAKHLPSGVTPIACPVTSTFTSGAQQAISDAPKYDCSKRSTVGQLSSTGKAVTFPGISRLLVGDTLSVVILPGSLGLERLVFSPPNNRTLSLLSFDGPAPVETPSIPPPATPSAPASGESAPATSTGAIPPVPGVTEPVPSNPAPAIAPTPGLTTVALSKPDDSRDRARALGMLLLLMSAVAWLVVTERGGRTPAPVMGIGRFRSERSGPPPTI